MPRIQVLGCLVCWIALLVHTTNAFAPPSTRLKTPSKAIFSAANTGNDLVMPDYLIMDSEDITNRPAIVDILGRPRNILPCALLAVGTILSVLSVTGNYNDSYLTCLIAGSGLGLASALLDLQDSLPPYGSNTPTESVSPNVRRGVVDDAVVHAYSGIYTACASWLVIRSSYACPSWWIPFDSVVGPLASAIFVFSLAAPALTLLYETLGIGENVVQFLVGIVRRQDYKIRDLPSFSETELLRANGLLAIGVVGCVYTPLVLSFCLLGQDWWTRVLDVYPGQAWVEPSTAFCGVVATQASMIGHRMGKAGAAPFSVIVPAFAVVVLLLAILPCVAVFYWLGDTISLFEYYSL